MIILSIETSCDETAVSIIEASGEVSSPSFKVLANSLYSQAETHAEYGGVFPVVAKREHGKNLVPMLASCIAQITTSASTSASIPSPTPAQLEAIQKVLERENGVYEDFIKFIEGIKSANKGVIKFPKIDAIAVTEGPGLEPALWVGISFAKALSLLLDLPIAPVNHMEGHIVSVLTDGKFQDENFNNGPVSKQKDIHFPAIALLISGGHTELVQINTWGDYSVIGATKDDAVGEAFDKVARILGFTYPGGPKISKLAEQSRSEHLIEKIEKETGSKPWNLPRPMLKTPDLHFSFSGLKTSVLYAVKDKTKDGLIKLSDAECATLAEEFENAVTEVLVYKTKKAIEQVMAKTLILGGGVIANSFIRKNFETLAAEENINLFIPSIDLSTDNSVMIGIAAFLSYTKNPSVAVKESDTNSDSTIRAKGNLSF